MLLAGYRLLQQGSKGADLCCQALGITELVVNMADGDSEGDRTPYAGQLSLLSRSRWLAPKVPGEWAHAPFEAGIEQLLQFVTVGLPDVDPMDAWLTDEMFSPQDYGQPTSFSSL